MGNSTGRSFHRVILATNDCNACALRCRALTNAGYCVELGELAEPWCIEKDTILLIELYASDSIQQDIVHLLNRITSNKPVVVVSPVIPASEQVRLLRAGVDRCLQKPVSDQFLTAVLDNTYQRYQRKNFKALCTGTKSEAVQEIADLLSTENFVVEVDLDPLGSIDNLSRINPEVIIVIGDSLPGIAVSEYVELVRGIETWASLPVFLVTDKPQAAHQRGRHPTGPTYWVFKPYRPEQVVTKILAAIHQWKELESRQNIYRSSLNKLHQEVQCINEHVGLSITDLDGNLIYVNDRFCRISGYDRAELIGQNPRLLKSGQHSSKIYKDLWKTISEGGIWQGVLCNKSRNGQLHWINTTIMPLADDAGKYSQYMAIKTNVTAMKMHQVALETLVESLAAPDTKSLLDSVTRAIAQIFEIDIAFVGRRHRDDPGRCTVLSFWDSDGWENNFEYDIAGTPCELIKRGESATFNDNVAELFSSFEFLRDNSIRGYFAVPLESADGSIIGQLGVMHREALADRFPHEHLLEIYARQISRELERRQAIVAQQLSEENYRLLASRIPGMVYNADNNWRPLQLADKKTFFGHLREHLLSPDNSWLELVHPNDRDRLKEESARMVRNRKDLYHEYRIVDGNGQWRWVGDHKHPRYNKDGVFLGVDGIVLDISEHKKIISKLAVKETQLEVAQTIAHMGSWSLEVSSGKLDWSKEAFRLLGFEPDSISPTLDDFAKHVHSDDIANLTLHRPSEWTMEQPVQEVEYRIKCSDNQYRFVHELARAEFSESGELLKLYGAIQDISDKKNGELSLRRAFDEAEHANKAKSEFLACMSHELRTPMNSILGFSQLMEHDNNLSDDHRENVLEISKAGKHLLQLINDVLDLTKVEAGKLSISLEPVSSHPVISECLNLMSQSAAKRNVQISRFDKVDTLVRADQVRLRQALLNLLSNAIKYNSESGEVKIRESRLPNGYVRFTVEDNGPGIPESAKDKVFEPFSRFATDELKAKGTGIGLAITRRLVELMGGSIGYKSSIGYGSQFWIELKAEGSATHQSDLAPKDKPGNTPSENYVRKENTHLILYIEDNPANMRLVELILSKRRDCELICAPSPELGIEMAENHIPDLILLDINLPRINGFEVLNRLKNIPSTTVIPVIAVTANALLRDVEKGKNAEFVDYLTKPINVEHFNTSLDRALGLD